MSKVLLVASIVAGVALATAAEAEPFGAPRARESAAPQQSRAAEEQRRHDLWEARERLAEQRERQRSRHRNAGDYPGSGYPGQAPYAYGAPYGGYGYGDDVAPPPRPAPPQSPRGLHNGLWYY
ncbi:hypothetical protein [Methylosinus sp. RM1]|uniref:hypothetical protein n=1 Tax=Methylosinus sp. RM1 TaxID=2583817 RepID=UPI00140840E6|nr:hypothetical protein [Methylosinus sp. RM1]